MSICYFCIYLYIFLGCRGFQTSENNDYFVFLFQQMHTDIQTQIQHTNTPTTAVAANQPYNGNHNTHNNNSTKPQQQLTTTLDTGTDTELSTFSKRSVRICASDVPKSPGVSLWLRALLWAGGAGVRLAWEKRVEGERKRRRKKERGE